MGSWRFYNVTEDADFWPVLSSINITNQQPCQLATFSGTIVDVDALSDGDEVQVLYAADDVTFVKQFAGFVSIETDAHIEPIAEPAVYHFSARDYTTLLDDTIITAERNVTESVTDRALWIAAQGNSFGITTGGIASIATLVGPFNYRLLSKTQAYEQLQSVSGVLFYVDFDKETQLYPATDVIAAPFDLVTPANPPTSYPYRAFTRSKDRTDQADEVIVGTQDGLFVTRTRGGAPAANLRKQRAITTDAVTAADLELVGDAELDRIGLPMQDGSLVIRQPGLQSGMTVRIVNPTHSIDADYIISSVSVRHVDPNPETVGGDGGRAEFTISWADRLQCIPQRDLSFTPPSNDGGGDDCQTCVKQVALMPSGFEGGNVILARGQSGTHAFDGTRLAHYRCDLTQVRTNLTVTTGTGRIYHEPFVDCPLVGGDVGLYLDEGLGSYGEERWNNGDAVSAAEVTDRRSFWVATAAGFETFTRITADTEVGFSDDGHQWATESASIPPPTYSVDGADYVVGISGDNVLESAAINALGPGPWSSTPFTLSVRGITFSAVNIDTTSVLVSAYGFGPTDGPSLILTRDNTGWRIRVHGSAGLDQASVTINVNTRYDIEWEHDPASTVSRARVYPTGGSPPAFQVTRDPTGDTTTDDDLYMEIGISAASPAPLTVKVSGIDFTGYTTPTLQRRRATTGELKQTVGLTLDAGVAVRRTPNGQHVYLIYADAASEMEKYSRLPALEATSVAAWGFDYTADPTFIDWNADDEGFVYALFDDGTGNAAVNKFTYPAIGGVWTTLLTAANLGTSDPYRAPTLATAGGNGQQIYLGRSSGGNHYDAYLRVVGYIGGADWTTGSDAVVITLRRSDGVIENVQRLGGDETTDAAQAIAIHRAGPCFHYVAVANGGTFEDLELPGLSAVIGRLPVGPT